VLHVDVDAAEADEEALDVGRRVLVGTDAVSAHLIIVPERSAVCENNFHKNNPEAAKASSQDNLVSDERVGEEVEPLHND